MFKLTISDAVMDDERALKDLEFKVNKLNDACDEYGYRSDFYIDYGKGAILNDEEISSKSEYSPIIRVSNEVLKNINVVTVTVQTTSFGALDVEDYENFYNDITKAFYLSKNLQVKLDDITSSL